LVRGPEEGVYACPYLNILVGFILSRLFFFFDIEINILASCPMCIRLTSFGAFYKPVIPCFAAFFAC
jgi:hypothetical protein